MVPLDKETKDNLNVICEGIKEEEKDITVGFETLLELEKDSQFQNILKKGRISEDRDLDKYGVCLFRYMMTANSEVSVLIKYCKESEEYCIFLGERRLSSLLNEDTKFNEAPIIISAQSGKDNTWKPGSSFDAFVNCAIRRALDPYYQRYAAAKEPPKQESLPEMMPGTGMRLQMDSLPTIRTAENEVDPPVEIIEEPAGAMVAVETDPFGRPKKGSKNG